MAQQAARPLRVPAENERITVLTTGEPGMGSLRHQEAGSADQRILYTEGISSCKVLATCTPGGGRTLLHANGGAFTDRYLQSLAQKIIQPNTAVIIANGNLAGSQDYFLGEVTDVQGTLNGFLTQAGKPPVTIVPVWTDINDRNSTTFALGPDGVYGRCDVAATGVGGGHKKKWYFCGLC